MYRLALAGIAVPIIILVTVVTAGFLEPGYSHISQLTSELATPEAKFGWATNLFLFFLTGPLMIAFALGMYLGIENSTKVGTGLLVIVGLALIGLGIFPCDPGCPPPPRTFSGHMHFPVLVSIITTSFLIAPFVFWHQLRRQPRWQGQATYSLLTGIVALLLILLGDALFLPWGRGLWQRLIFGVLFLWVGVLAMRLFKTSI